MVLKKSYPSIEERRRRLEADAEDARKALQRAQALFESICDELVELRYEEKKS